MEQRKRLWRICGIVGLIVTVGCVDGVQTTNASSGALIDPGDRTCTSGVCCDVASGTYLPAGAPCTNGAGYCNGGSTCTGATYTLDPTSAYGGSFETSDPGCATDCQNPNNLAGVCECPAGFVADGNLRVLNDCAGLHGGYVSTCLPQVRDQFGGAYQVDDAVPGGYGCRKTNPYTGACSCPGGTSAVALRTIVDNGGGRLGSTLYYCGQVGAQPTTYGGVFQQDDPAAGGYGCRRANPYTGSCACPAGFESQKLRVIVDGYAGFIGSTISTCAPRPAPVALCGGQYADPTARSSATGALQQCISGQASLTLPVGNYLVEGTGVTINKNDFTLQTANAAGAGTCLNSSARCARLVGGYGLNRAGGLLVASGNNITLDHVIIDGNRAGRVGSTAWATCTGGYNRLGFNAQFSGCTSCGFLSSASINAVCGTGLEWSGDYARVNASLFRGNGQATANMLWADGLTLLSSNYAVVTNNKFWDNSDVGFIMGGMVGGVAQYNEIRQSSQHAFGGMMLDNFNGGTSGDFTGAVISDNTITCEPWWDCSYAVNIGPHAWYVPPQSVHGATLSRNTVRGGYITLNVDGAYGITLRGNVVSTGAGTAQLCPGVYASTFNLDAGDSSVDADIWLQSIQSTHGCH
ncbi:MAG TPA: hypothetical protein VGQ83_24670 [Polyangia bacterium]